MRVRTTPTIGSVAFLMDITHGLAGFAMPLTLKTEFGMSEDWVGALLGTSGLFYITFAYFAGGMSDRLGATVVIRLGAGLIFLNCLVFSFAQSAWLYVLCALTSAAGHAFFWPAFQAWFGKDVGRHEMARRVGIFSVSWSLGLNFAGPKFGGLLMESAPRAPFVAAALCALGVLLFFQLLKPELSRWEVHPSHEADEFRPREIRRRFLRGARLANLMAVYSIVTYRNFLPMLLVDWGLTESQIGSLMMVLGLAHSGTFLALTLTHRWHYRWRYLLAGELLGMIGLLAFGLLAGGIDPTSDDQTPWLGVILMLPSMLMAGGMAGICFMSSAFYGLFGEEEKGKNSGINESIIGSAGVLALYLGGIAFHIGGESAPYWTCGVLVGACVFIQVSRLAPWRVGKSA